MKDPCTRGRLPPEGATDPIQCQSAARPRRMRLLLVEHQDVLGLLARRSCYFGLRGQGPAVFGAPAAAAFESAPAATAIVRTAVISSVLMLVSLAR
jgi:hypothetical protein